MSPKAFCAGAFPFSKTFPLIPLLTSTERIFPKAKKKGCMLMSGSLRKQLGLAWCWKCKWFHQLAGAPYRKARHKYESQMSPLSSGQSFIAQFQRAPPHPTDLQVANHEMMQQVVPCRGAEDRQVPKVML